MTNKLETIISSNKNIFTGFIKNISGKIGIEFYVPNSKLDVFTMHNEYVVLTDVPKRKLPKLDKRFDWSTIDRRSKYKKYIKVRVFPHKTEDLDIHEIVGYRGSRFIITEKGLPLVNITTNTKGWVESVELYNLPKFTNKYINISNLFIDITLITTLYNPYDKEDSVTNTELTFQCTQLINGELAVLERFRYKLPQLILDNEDLREEIYDNIYDDIYKKYLCDGQYR